MTDFLNFTLLGAIGLNLGISAMAWWQDSRDTAILGLLAAIFLMLVRAEMRM